MKKNLLRCLGKSLCQVETHYHYLEARLRHPEFISGSRESKEMLKQVQHDDNHTGQMLNPVQDDGYPTGQASNPAQYGGWRRTSFSLGRSMIEMLGVLAIIGVLSVGGLLAYRQAMVQYQINDIENLITHVKFSVFEKCATAEECAFALGDNSQEAFKKNLDILCQTLPADMCVKYKTTTTIRLLPSGLKWGVLYFHQRPSSIAPYIYLSQVSNQLCLKMLDHTWRDLFQARVNDSTVLPAPNGALSDENKETLKGYCTQTNSMRLDFRIKP